MWETEHTNIPNELKDYSLLNYFADGIDIYSDTPVGK